MKGLITASAACLAVLVAGCGGASPQSPQAPQGPGAQEPQTEQRPGAAPVESGGEGLHESPPLQYSPAPSTIGTLLGELLAAEALVLSAGSTCDTACRALRSMERSAERLCAIASDDAEMETCEQARARVEEARRRVRAACGACSEEDAR